MALYEEFEPRPNRLINAQSAYLRSAAYQPVGWYEFGPEAFTEALREDRPILLDIGAAWCHWCHVIDRESYENPEIATLINEHFIPIKVDRDERPDIDARYQLAVQILTGQGGWPLTVFLTPQGDPFYGGTYFPPEDQHGRVGMSTLLPRIAEAYRHRQLDLEKVSQRLAEAARLESARVNDPGLLSFAAFTKIANVTQLRFHPRDGGFEESGPKFPHPGAVELALLQWLLTGDETWRDVFAVTLMAMGRGGIYDQLGGGFHRYATDAAWLVPHFEKMSLENGLLLENYVHAYRATGNEFFHEIADGTLDFINGVLADHRDGGFYASQDADNSPTDDGDYWTWTQPEVREAVVPAISDVLIPHYGIGQSPGIVPATGKSVPHIAEEAEALARRLEVSGDEIRERIEHGEQLLAEIRRERHAPGVDTNKYCNWNAVLISALLEAGTLLNRPEAVNFALRSTDLLLSAAYDEDQGMYHGLISGAGARLPGFLEDQVFMARALLDAFTVSGKHDYLQAARRLLDLCIDHYWDTTGGGFFDLTRERMQSEQIPMLRQPRKAIEDLPGPAPNAIAALTLDRLWLLTRDDRYHEYAWKTLEAFADHAPGYGPFAAYYGLAVYYHYNPPALVTIIGRSDDEGTRQLRQTALAAYRPGRQVIAYAPDEEELPYPAAENGKAIAYLCAGERCAAPTSDAGELQRLLSDFGK
ncbi:MAG: thioredoxin domain-containing protein [Armatimonadota bacterium]